MKQLRDAIIRTEPHLAMAAGTAPTWRATDKQKDFHAWVDKQRLAAGAIRTEDIERALDNTEFVLALIFYLGTRDWPF